MARTERRRAVVLGRYDAVIIDPNGRDAKGRCWCCGGWKRAARRNERHAARVALRRDPDSVRGKGNATNIW